MVRVQKDSRRRDTGLGSEKKVSLAQARELAAEVRSQVQVRIDPIAARRKREGILTFGKAAANVLAEHQRAGAMPSIAGNGFRRCKPMHFRTSEMLR